MKDINLESHVKKIIISFAKTHPLINAVSKGINPEERSDVPYYYFITKPKFNEKLSDLISDLNLFIANTIGYNCELLEWPLNSISESDNYPFLGDCLWRRR